MVSASKFLNTTVNIDEFLRSHSYIITIDGYEYTAITDRSYSLQTDSPSRIIQSGFDYSGHSNVQPMTVDYTIVVSKANQTELQRLMGLFQYQTIFTMINPVHVIDRCIITSISVNDNTLDFLTLDVSFQELNSSVQYASTTAVSSFQLYAGGGGTSKCSLNADTSDYCQSTAKADSDNYTDVMSGELVTAAETANAENLPFRGANTKTTRVVYKNETAEVTTTDDLEKEDATESNSSLSMSLVSDTLKSLGMVIPDQ